jgi:hypothetical protein
MSSFFFVSLSAQDLIWILEMRIQQIIHLSSPSSLYVFSKGILDDFFFLESENYRLWTCVFDFTN